MSNYNMNEIPLEERMVHVTIEEGEEGGLCSDEGEEVALDIDDRWCLVGKFLTGRNVDFQAMQQRMTSLWQPGRGIFVKELDNNMYLFQFYHEVDIKRVIEGSPWTFDRIQLVFQRLKVGENPRRVVLNKLDMWVQLHDMAAGFMSERIVRDVRNYIGSFVKSDKNNFTGVWRDYLRVRVTLNIEKPLKRRMKLEKKGGRCAGFSLSMKAYPHSVLFAK